MTDTGPRPALRKADRRLAVAGWALVMAPVVAMLGLGLGASRNVAYMDDIDSTLMLLMRLHDGGSWRDLLGWLFELDNEHRMVGSRLLYLASYALTGTVDFVFFGVIGNLFLCGLCALLVQTAGAAERKWTMALLLAGLLFQLQHFGNFFWAGSSIDHFQVPLLAGLAVYLLARGEWTAWLGAGVAAGLATFTLAHGLAVWPVGVLMLVADRRWPQLVAWLALGAAATAGYFAGFEYNPAHQIGDYSVPGLARIGRYWLEIIGAPFALRHQTLAAILGAILLAALGWQVKRGGLRQERIALPLALWAVAALGVIAVGRASLGSGVLISRYYVLAGLAWALAIFAALHQRRDEVRLDRTLRWLGPGLIAFNCVANMNFAGLARQWVDDRDQAVADFMRHGRDGAGRTALHPLPQHATRVIRQAEQLGVFEMPRESKERSFAGAQAGTGFANAVDRIVVDENMVTIEGWAAIAGRAARPGEVHVVLRSAESEHVLTTSAAPRPDVAAAFPGERWSDAGFHFALRRWLVPAENYQLGFLIPTEGGAELTMTAHRVDLADGGSTIEKDRVAPNRIVYDELVLRGPVSSVTATPGKFMRVSFCDLQDGLVHVDFSGPGDLTVALGSPTPLDPPPRDRGRVVARMKGSAAISITGADEATHVAVVAARRQPPRPAAGDSRTSFDGMAHIALISIASRNGRFGGVRTGNAIYSAQAGITGIQAPGVRFAGPVNMGDINASAAAVPRIELGFSSDTRIAGGDLSQPNGQPVSVSGISRLSFVEGRTAQGLVRPARSNRALLLQDGQDVSVQIAGSRPAPATTGARGRE